jgi:hypothetical protein
MRSLEDAHEEGRHISRLHPDCARCAWEAPAIRGLQETVRYITGGKLIDPPKGWLRADPPRTDLDDEDIDLRLERELFEPDLGPDDEGPGEWPG